MKKKCAACKKNREVSDFKENRKCCNECLFKYNITNKERVIRSKAGGTCWYCNSGSPPTHINSRACELCGLKRAAGKTLKSIARAKEIGELLKAQNYLCVYSGVRLYLGFNASLDHKIPQSRGGSDDIENLQWVESGINYMKRTKTHDEFLPYLVEITSGIASVMKIK